VYEWEMPATRPNRLKNPLRKLRLLLGDGQKPLGQEEFAARAGLSVATVRSIEAGSRPLSDGALKQIAVVLKAQWLSEPVAQWRVIGTTLDYEAKYADSAYFDPGDAYSDDYSVHKLVERVLDIFGAANRGQRTALLIHLNQYLKETAQSFGINKDLNATEPQWKQTFKPMIWGKKLGKNVVVWPQYKDLSGKWCLISPHADEGGIFDFRARRSFNPADYPARTAAEVEQLSQASTHDNETVAVKPSKNKRTLSAPKRNQSENKVENRVSKKTVDQV
jgi:transcriptional regulator with XRE-family HTH domain